MSTKTRTTTTATPAIYTFAERCTGTAIRARHEKSGLKLLEQLQNASSSDRAARNAAEIATREADHRAAADEHTAAADTLAQVAHRITTPDEERTAAATEAAAHRAAAKRERTAAEVLAAELSRTYSDRADIVQSALLALCELTAKPAPVLKPIPGGWTTRPAKSAAAAAAIIAKADPDTLAAMRADIWHTCTNAAGRAINQAAAPDALNRTVTQATPATAAEVAAWIAKHGATGTAIKEPQTVKRCRASECYDTMEYRNRKTAPGWYRVRHWVTVAPYTSIDQLNESGDITGYFKSYNPFTESQGTAERLEALQTAAALTERERLFISAFCSTTAAKHGAVARRKYHDNPAADLDHKHTREAANNAEYAAMLDFAFATIGITGAESRKKFVQRLRARLASAPVEQTVETPAEHAERTAKRWECMQSNRTRGHATDNTPRPDCLAWTDKASSSRAAAPVIAWIDHDHAEASRAAAAEQTAAILAESHIDNTTAENRQRAAEAAKAYTAKHTKAAAEKAARAAAKAAADKTAEIKATAHRLDVATLDTNFTIWKKWTEEQRAAHAAWLDILAKA